MIGKGSKNFPPLPSSFSSWRKGGKPIGKVLPLPLPSLLRYNKCTGWLKMRPQPKNLHLKNEKALCESFCKVEFFCFANL